MNRRDFFKAMGAVAVASVLPATAANGPTTYLTAIPLVTDAPKPRVRAIADAIITIDPNETPLLRALAAGKTLKIEDWPGYKTEWIEDVLIPMERSC